MFEKTKINEKEAGDGPFKKNVLNNQRALVESRAFTLLLNILCYCFQIPAMGSWHNKES